MKLIDGSALLINIRSNEIDELTTDELEEWVNRLARRAEAHFIREGPGQWHCSICGTSHGRDARKMAYCPSCGARIEDFKIEEDLKAPVDEMRDIALHGVPEEVTDDDK